MKKFLVNIPVTVRLTVEAEAENEKEVIKKIFYDSNIGLDVTMDESDKDHGIKSVKIQEWDMHEKVLEGDVYYHGVINEIDIQKID